MGDNMDLINGLIYGILIGIGAILPGISSGVICMVIGIYEKLINSILGFFKDIKNNIKFLLPICVGSALGILIFSNIIIYCFNVIPCQTKSLFIGLLLGSIYVLHKNNASKIGASSSISFTVCFIIGIILIFLEKIIFVSYTNTQDFNFIFLVLSGFLMSIGIVVPGVSSTVILMLLGVYNTYLSAISSINFHILIPMGIGLILGSFVFMNIIKFLLDKYNQQTIFGIIGFSLGSVLILYPGYFFNLESLIGIFLLFLGFLIGKNIKK